MWRIQNLEKGEVTLDFSSAGLGMLRTSALTADDTTIVNATTLVDMEDDACAQVIVCTSCGTVHCEPGGWIQPRRFGAALLWLPCFERLADDNLEYRPPDFFKTRGLPFFDGVEPQLLGPASPFPLGGHAIRDPSRRRLADSVASSGELETVVTQIEAVLHEALSDVSLVRPARATPGPELYLDGAKATPTWNPLVVDDVGNLRLSVDGVTAAVRDPG